MWADEYRNLNDRRAFWQTRALDAESKLCDTERKLGLASAEIDNLQAALSKAQRNDVPKDVKTEKFKKKK
jgi:hypothetical protein